MNKKINRPYLFLAITIIMMMKAISLLTHFFGFHLGSMFHGYIVSQFADYPTGRFIGGITTIILLADLSVYFFSKFKKVAYNSTLKDFPGF